MNPVIPKKLFADLHSIYTDMPSYPAGEDCVKVPAGWMIDRCGWKGKSLGRAGVHAFRRWSLSIWGELPERKSWLLQKQLLLR